jgi:hypothetical protein
MALYLATNVKPILKMKTFLRSSCTFLLILLITLCSTDLSAQSKGKKKQIVIDIAHGQKFWNDPADMAGADTAFVSRIKYMTRSIEKNASDLNAVISYQKTPITPESLSKCDLLFIHIPSKKFEAGEVEAIQKYVQKGGSLFLVMEVDYWATLAQANVNDILSPFGIVFKSDNPDQNSGGHSKPGAVTASKLSIPYHGARLVEGGTPLCYSNATEENPFGVYKEVKNGGRIIAMGDGMVSLYMTSWEGVNDYQCSSFMADSFSWLLKKGK